MARVSTYRPRSLSLPPQGGLSRAFVDRRSHRAGEPPLGAADLARYERHTLFHDAFLAGGSLCALGPPLGSLARHVRPIRCRLLHPDGSASAALAHRVERRERCTLHRFRLPPAAREADALRARVELATGQRAELEVLRTSLPPRFLQLATLQKDSPFAWLADWLGHAARLGVERVLLYDNGSADAAELPARLDALAESPEVVLVHWPFPYGPGRSHYNQFAQASQLEHAHLALGGAEWTGHFDVDEYPVCDDGRGLAEWLREVPPRTGMLRLDSWWAPRVQMGTNAGDGSGDMRGHGDGAGTDDSRATPVTTVRDFPFRERAPRGRAHKYLVRARALRSARVHNARLRWGWRRRYPDPERLAFVHYLALNTGWKGERGRPVPLDHARHVEERRVLDALAPLDAVGGAPGDAAREDGDGGAPSSSRGGASAPR